MTPVAAEGPSTAARKNSQNVSTQSLLVTTGSDTEEKPQSHSFSAKFGTE